MFGGGLWSSSGVLSIIVILAALMIGGGMLITGFGNATGTCPLCDKVFNLGVMDKHHRCPYCFGYSESDKRIEQLSAVEEGRTEAKPTFLVPLPKAYRLPRICCVCGRPASGSRTVHARYNLRSEILPVSKHIEYSLDIPYCEDHAQDTEAASAFNSTLLGPGVETALDARSKKADGASVYQVPGLKVSSYRFYREFLLLNGIKNHFDPQIPV